MLGDRLDRSIKSKKSNHTEYRPIALTSAMCKVFERIKVLEILNHTKQLYESNKRIRISTWSKQWML